MLLPTEILHALAVLDDHSRTVVRDYLEKIESKHRHAVAQELDARGKVSRLKAAINDAIQNTRGLPPECRMHLMDAMLGLAKE